MGAAGQINESAWQVRCPTWRVPRRDPCIVEAPVKAEFSAAWNLAASPVPIRGILPSIDWPTKPAAAEDAGRKNLLPRSGHLRVLEQSRFGASGSLGPLNNEHPVPKIMPSPTPLHAEKPTEYQVQSVKGRREESSFLAQPSPARYYVSAWLVTRLLNRYPCMLARHSVKLLAAP